MGMYDEVNHCMNCPNCGEHIPPWTFQTKDCQCNLARIDFRFANEFYTRCSKCKVWIEFHRKTPAGSIDDYEMFVVASGASQEEHDAYLRSWAAPNRGRSRPMEETKVIAIAVIEHPPQGVYTRGLREVKMRVFNGGTPLTEVLAWAETVAVRSLLVSVQIEAEAE